VSTVIDQRTDKTSALARLAHRARKMNELVVLIVVIVLFTIMSFASPYFLTWENMSTLAIGLAADGIIAVGMTVALASGGFDLSVGAVMGLTAIATAYFAAQGTPMWIAVIGGFFAAAVVGSLNGWLISRVRINPFITTLGTMTITRGLVYVISDGSSIPMYEPPAFLTWLGKGDVLGIPSIFVIFIIVAVVGDFLLRRSAAARQVYYVGSNAKAARLSGINVARVEFTVYVLVALLAAVAGILSLARFGTATPAMGTGAEMRVISAAVIGGASIAGGMGTVLGTVLGVILLNVIQNALVLLNVSVNWQNLIAGSILIVAVAIDTLSRRPRSARGRGRFSRMLASVRTRRD